MIQFSGSFFLGHTVYMERAYIEHCMATKEVVSLPDVVKARLL